MGSEMVYPVGDSSFGSIRGMGAVYIDKTAQIHALVAGGKYYFLSRPRRFGKSLLISTLEAYFKGRRELFKGLALERLETEWVEYPVLHIDWSAANYDSADKLEKTLEVILYDWEEEYGRVAVDSTYENRFKRAIKQASARAGRGVVVLVDEYDKPLLDALGDRALVQRNQETLRGFYGVLKALGDRLRFVFLTGVTQFSHVGIFSGLNNLEDISMDARYATLCGITEGELRTALAAGVARLAAARGLDEAACYARLRARYDGYRFSPWAEEGVYNPFSLLLALKQRSFGSYWFATGTPTYLVRTMQETGRWVDDLAGAEVELPALGGIRDPYQNPLALFYQAGYLTLGGPGAAEGTWRLRFPNGEVEEGFRLFVQECYLPGALGSATYSAAAFHRLLAEGDAEGFMGLLDSFFRVTNYEVVGSQEKYYQNTLRALFMLMGARTEVEHRTAAGRIDLLAWLPRYVYLFEIKMGQGAAAALRQVEARGYARGVDPEGRQLIVIGVSFSRTERGIQEWEVAR